MENFDFVWNKLNMTDPNKNQFHNHNIPQVPSSNPEPDIEIKSESKKKSYQPPKYFVILHNDDYTTMEFVVFVLQVVFKKDSIMANEIMIKIHKEGSAVCGVYIYEIAETKVQQVKNLAQENEFPLKCTMRIE